MSEDSLHRQIQEHMELIKYSTKGVREAPERAASFLIIQAMLLEEVRACTDDLAKLDTLATASKFRAYSSAAGNTTDKRASAEADPEHTGVSEARSQCEAKIKMYKGYIDIFNNAHLLYRQFAKE